MKVQFYLRNFLKINAPTLHNPLSFMLFFISTGCENWKTKTSLLSLFGQKDFL